MLGELYIQAALLSYSENFRNISSPTANVFLCPKDINSSCRVYFNRGSKAL